MSESRFIVPHLRIQRSRMEFQHFISQADLEHVQAIGERDERFRELEEIFAFFRFPRTDDALQFDFGNRATPHRTVTGGIVAEKGPTLLYTLAPTGQILTLIYPAKSDVHKSREDCIALRAGFYTAYQLLKALPQDLRDLVTYCNVTSMGSAPTRREKIRVAWLRWARGISIGGVGIQPSSAAVLTSELIAAGTKAAAKGLAKSIGLAILTLLVLPLVIAGLVAIGFPEIGLKLGNWLSLHTAPR